MLKAEVAMGLIRNISIHQEPMQSGGDEKIVAGPPSHADGDRHAERIAADKKAHPPPGDRGHCAVRPGLGPSHPAIELGIRRTDGRHEQNGVDEQKLVASN